MENLEWGLRMTVLGMGLVFALLALLWGVLTLVLVLDPQSQAPLPASRQAAGEDLGADLPLAGPGQVDALPADLVAAILVATLQHKSTLRRQAAPLMRRDCQDSTLFASRWVSTGRARQNTTWQPRGK